MILTSWYLILYRFYVKILELVRGDFVRLSEYKIKCEKIHGKYKFAVISDLHGCDPTAALELLRSSSPDFILAPGDILETVDGSDEKHNAKNERGLLLLRESAKIAPTFYSTGNHEIGGTRSWARGLQFSYKEAARWSEENLAILRDSNVHLLDDSYVFSDVFAFGGLSSGILNEGGKPSFSWIREFSAAGCPKILLCHHPEYYAKYLSGYDIDLIVSGHAHGGQWCFFGRGVFAPGQGLFPKYTKGIHDGRLAVSRGMKEARVIPRFFNPTEVVLVRVN